LEILRNFKKAYQRLNDYTLEDDLINFSKTEFIEYYIICNKQYSAEIIFDNKKLKIDTKIPVRWFYWNFEDELEDGLKECQEVLKKEWAEILEKLKKVNVEVITSKIINAANSFLSSPEILNEENI